VQKISGAANVHSMFATCFESDGVVAVVMATGAGPTDMLSTSLAGDEFAKLS